MGQLPLTLLVAGGLADDEHRAVAADDLALLAHRLNRRSYLHGPFPRVWPGDALWLPREQPLLRHGWRARRGSAHARTNDDSKGVTPPSGGERSPAAGLCALPPEDRVPRQAFTRITAASAPC